VRKRKRRKRKQERQKRGKESTTEKAIKLKETVS
jgi:hypothetical protein